MPRSKGCRCRKRLYRDTVGAMLALAEIQRKDRPQSREQRYYPCPDGQGYHLTSQGRRAR
jgi:hypothetical protein